MASKKIIEAIKAVRSKVTSLKKDEVNKHGGYNFVPIDTYYEKVAKVANDAGLIWRTKEIKFDTLDGQGKNRDRTYAKVTFSYDLFVDEDEFLDYMQVTIMAPIDGAQTTGIVYSYADKVFMRVAFCVVTGEQDADSTPSEPIHSSPKKDEMLDDDIPAHDPSTGEITSTAPTFDPPLFPEEQVEYISKTAEDGLPTLDTRKVNPKAVPIIEEIFKQFIPTIKKADRLLDFNADNLAALEMVKKIDPSASERIRAMFNSRNREIKNK